MNNVEKTSVLVIDDEPSLLRYFEYNIKRAGYNVRTGGSIAELFDLLERDPHAVLLLDLMLPDGEALDHLPKILAKYPMLSVVLVSAHGTIPKAVKAIKLGAVQFLQKPVSPEALETVLHTAAEVWRLKTENTRLRRKLEPAGEFQGMVGQSEPMQKIYEMIESVAVTLAPVMITGESGTGKELVARAIHAVGPRADRPCIPINCAAIPRDLLESEIFGHERGAFTGAIDQYHGCFERADTGTLFLDEICEMDVALQVKLLRLIQEQSFYRIGGTKHLRVNVRIVAATNKDPLKMVEEGKFREDLFYRLNVLPIHLPPLRERREDISMVSTHFLHEVSEQNHKEFQGFELPALRALEAYEWPGNIRELRNTIEQVVVLNDAEKVTFEMLPERFQQGLRAGHADHATAGSPRAERVASRPGGPNGSLAGDSAELRPFWQVERDEIQRALDLCGGNVEDAARGMEISSATLYRKIKKYGLVR